jgi:hypothetical protein
LKRFAGSADISCLSSQVEGMGISLLKNQASPMVWCVFIFVQICDFSVHYPLWKCIAGGRMFVREVA